MLSGIVRELSLFLFSLSLLLTFILKTSFLSCHSSVFLKKINHHRFHILKESRKPFALSRVVELESLGQTRLIKL